MFYIYCYTNKINNKKYVGQTNWPAARYSQHKYAAFTPDSPEYNFLFHRKLREYGMDNFNFEILEEIDTTDLEYVDAREAYWIKEKSSYVKTGQGYNLTLGGQQKGRHKLLEPELIKQVINLLENTTLTYREISEQTKVNLKTIVNINRGTYAGCISYKYPIRKLHKISDEIKENIKELLLTSNMTRQEIADVFDVSLSTVKRIKAQLDYQKPVSTIKG